MTLGILKNLDAGKSGHWVCCFQELSRETHTLCLLASVHTQAHARVNFSMGPGETAQLK